MNKFICRQYGLLITLCVLMFSWDSSAKGREYKTPWMMGVKTNILSDALVIPDLGVELQLGKHLSLGVNGRYTQTNIFCHNDHTKVYGVSPEIRWWFGKRTMQKGHFIGVDGNFSWYTLEWIRKDGSHALYQNGKENEYSEIDAGSSSPAWSFGVLYGYSVGLDRKAHWGLEFVFGLGYRKAVHNVGQWSATPVPAWYFTGNETRSGFGITKLGINLTYRFSLRKVSPEYYK